MVINCMTPINIQGAANKYPLRFFCSNRLKCQSKILPKLFSNPTRTVECYHYSIIYTVL